MRTKAVNCSYIFTSISRDLPTLLLILIDYQV